MASLWSTDRSTHDRRRLFLRGGCATSRPTAEGASRVSRREAIVLEVRVARRWLIDAVALRGSFFSVHAAGDGTDSVESQQFTNPVEQSRAVPIGDYGFLSDGEVSALVAPSGSVDWMCLPRFDAPSVFGSILGRRAGSFTVAPLEALVPAARRYLPGTMILETSWGTPTGWMIVRDVLLIGPWHHQDDRSKTYRRTPTDYEAEHVLLRTIRCVSGEVQTIMDCEPVLDYGRTPVDWKYTGDSYHQGRATAADSDVSLTLTTDMLLGFEGGQASARTMLKEGDTRFVALSWGGAVPPDDLRRRLPEAGLDSAPLAALAGRGQVPRPPLAQLPAAQRADPARADLRPDRRGDGGEHDVLAGDAGRQPQLRLPLHLDPRRDLRPVGDVLARLRLGGGGLLLLHRRPRRGRRRPADHVRHRGRARPDRVDPRPSARVRRLPAGQDRQRGARPEAARRLGGAAGLGLPALQGGRPPRQPHLADPRQAGGRRRSSTGASRTPASGRSGESSSTSRRRRSCAGSRSIAAPGWPG